MSSKVIGVFRNYRDQTIPEILYSYYIWSLFTHSQAHGTQTRQTSPIKCQIRFDLIKFAFIDIFQGVDYHCIFNRIVFVLGIYEKREPGVSIFRKPALSKYFF